MTNENKDLEDEKWDWYWECREKRKLFQYRLTKEDTEIVDRALLKSVSIVNEGEMVTEGVSASPPDVQHLFLREGDKIVCAGCGAECERDGELMRHAKDCPVYLWMREGDE
jgi:hypothetical protein